MRYWRVTVTLNQSDDYPKLSPEKVLEFDTSLPGGGTSSSEDGSYVTGPRRFTKAVEVEADDSDAAEVAARELVEGSIDQDKYPGWSVEKTGEPSLR